MKLIDRFISNAAAVMLIALLLVASLTGCTMRDVRSALSAVSTGAQWLGSLLEVADADADAWLARHPSIETQHAVDTALRRARLALAALDGTVAAGHAADSGELVAARREALAAYRALVELLDEVGVLSGRGPAGGAETEAPAPEPVQLPAVEVVAVALGGG